MQLVGQPRIDTPGDQPGVECLAAVLVQCHLELNQITCIQIGRLGPCCPAVESKVTVVLAPDDRISIMSVAPKNYTKHWLSRFSIYPQSETKRRVREGKIGRRALAFCV